jgi:hypothetical protein
MRKKAKYCKACEMKFMGNHVCTGLNRKVLYDDPLMVDIVKGVAKGPDVQMLLELPEPVDGKEEV